MIFTLYLPVGYFSSNQSFVKKLSENSEKAHSDFPEPKVTRDVRD